MVVYSFLELRCLSCWFVDFTSHNALFMHHLGVTGVDQVAAAVARLAREASFRRVFATFRLTAHTPAHGGRVPNSVELLA
jgi:hypothetical protein